MFKFKKIKINKVKEFLVKSLRAMAEHSFLTFLGFFIISLVLGVFIFFQFKILIESPAKEIGAEKHLKIETKAYQKIREEWDERSAVLSGSEPKKYPNPFSH